MVTEEVTSVKGNCLRPQSIRWVADLMISKDDLVHELELNPEITASEIIESIQARRCFREMNNENFVPSERTTGRHLSQNHPTLNLAGM